MSTHYDSMSSQYVDMSSQYVIAICPYVIIMLYACLHLVGPVEYNVQIGLTWYHKSIALKPKAGESSRVDDPASRKPNKLWRDEDVDMLVNARCQTNPPTFKHIASQINLMNASLGVTIDRPFDEVDCTNKWNKMFPTSEDANKTVVWLTFLKKCWPGLHFETETSPSEAEGSAPCLTAIYIVWPWTRELMKALAVSIFCDATFEITVFNYKLVFITTLDGNKQHRPLMCSFILRSVTTQWAKIFRIFVLYGGASDGDTEIYVVTTDQEKAIRAGRVIGYTDVQTCIMLILCEDILTTCDDIMTTCDDIVMTLCDDILT